MESKKDTTRRTMKGQNVPNFTEDEARAYFEKLRWPDGPACVHCGSVSVYRLQGQSTRPGLLECRDCQKQFSVMVGTVMEDTHLPLSTWAKAYHLMCSSKKGISALQLQRNLGLGSYRTAWHLAHRIREAMRCEPEAGSMSGIVESDEAWVGGKPRKVNGRGGTRHPRHTDKQPVQTLVQRDGKKVTRVIADVTAANLKANIDALVDKSKTTLMTDEGKGYTKLGREFAGGHKTVEHGVYEYAKPDGSHINTAESSHSLIKRGIYGTFHHVSKVHLQRYLDQFDFLWNGRKVTDTERRDMAVRGSEGKRLMYRQPVV